MALSRPAQPPVTRAVGCHRHNNVKCVSEGKAPYGSEQNERTNWIPRARVILSESEVRKFAPFQQLPVPGEIEATNAARMIAEFAGLRQESVAVLRGLNLEPQDYGRTGEHPSLGTVTLGQLLATWVVHDLNHVHQILKSLAKLQREAVGPWRQYLAILDL